MACERWPGETLVVGFSTDHGTVSAASDWDAPVERKRVRPALEESYEQLFHTTEIPAFLIAPQEIDVLAQPRLERAIGGVYRPRTERLSHYFHAQLSAQFDALIHIDETEAVVPLAITAEWEQGELPETYPSAL